MTSDVIHLLASDKTIFRIGIPTQRNKQAKKMQILSRILQFSWQERIQKMKLFKYYTDKDKHKFWQNCHQDRNLPLIWHYEWAHYTYRSMWPIFYVPMMLNKIAHFKGKLP